MKAAVLTLFLLLPHELLDNACLAKAPRGLDNYRMTQHELSQFINEK